MTTQEAFDWIMANPDARESWSQQTDEAKTKRDNPLPYLAARVHAAWGVYATVDSDKLARLLLLHFDRVSKTLVP